MTYALQSTVTSVAPQIDQEFLLPIAGFNSVILEPRQPMIGGTPIPCTWTGQVV